MVDEDCATLLALDKGHHLLRECWCCFVVDRYLMIRDIPWNNPGPCMVSRGSVHPALSVVLNRADWATYVYSVCIYIDLEIYPCM